jgi:hypothetical protein
MKRVLNNIEWPVADEWHCLKLSLLFIWLGAMPNMVHFNATSAFPAGLCKLYSFDPLFSPWLRPVLIATLLVVACLYFFEIKMMYTTFVMFLLSLIIISHKESSGILDRATLFSPIFGVQFLAYFRYNWNTNFNIKFYRVQYCVQIVAAMYVLSGISKLLASGPGWINGGELFPVQAVKNASFAYFTTGVAASLEQGYTMAYYALAHKHLVKLLLAGTLFLEVSCFIAAYNLRMRIIYGLSLALMHIGIYVFMDILIAVVVWPMIIFFLNPLYWVTVLAGRIKTISTAALYP